MLVDRVGIPLHAICQAPTASGDTLVRLLNDAANAIVRGDATMCANVGGEALRTAAAQNPGKPPFRGSLRSASEFRRKYGLVKPGEIYPLCENALHAALGQTLAESQAETGAIWSMMSEVATKVGGRVAARCPLGGRDLHAVC